MSILASLKFIFPEIILLVCALIILMLGAFLKKKRNILGILGLAGLASAIFILPQSFTSGPNVFFSLMVNDSFALFFKYISLLTAAIVILISIGHKQLLDEDRGEYYFLLLVLTIAMMLVVSSRNLLMIYIGIETVSLLSYILTAFYKKSLFSSEGALKYFLFGSLASSLMLYGISFVYGLFGTLELSMILSGLEALRNNFVVFIPLLLIFAGLSFKCAFVPFHLWVPDAYQGAPTPVTALISVGPKAIGFAVLLRIFLGNIFISTASWMQMVSVVAIFTMTFGNVVAVTQTNVKRLLGYSSIAQAGYILIGFVAASSLGIRGVLVYLLVYLFMNLGAFGCVAMISDAIKSDEIKDYAGLYKRWPFVSFMLTVFLLSLAGIPPLAGFLAKFLVFAAAVEANLVLLVVAGVVNSVIALYYYVKIIRFMYLSEPKDPPIQGGAFMLKTALVITGIGVLLIGVWPGLLLGWINRLQF